MSIQASEKAGETLIKSESDSPGSAAPAVAAAEELQRRGVTLDPHLRPVVGNQQLVEDRALRKVIRTFLTHSKGSRLTDQDLAARVHRSRASPVRAELFLRLFIPIRAGLEPAPPRQQPRRLRRHDQPATDLIERGHEVSFDVVMVDEWQDASAARAGLVRALVKPAGRYLFAVGDDWQSINRFAGAGLSVMTQFHEWFGPGETLKLERTFRSPQIICDVAGAFVSKNPAQVDKHVISTQPAVEAFAVDTPSSYFTLIAGHLDRLDATEERRQPTGSKPTRATVLILGRYRKTRDLIAELLERSWPHLQLRYSTMHASNGGEANHVIIVDLVAGDFPSTIEDDPLLGIAMPGGDLYPFANERRLSTLR